MKRAVLLLAALLAVPSASSAFQAGDVPKAEVFAITVKSDGTLEAPGRKEALPLAALGAYLKEPAAGKKGPVKAVALQAGKTLDVQPVYQAALRCRAEGVPQVGVQAAGASLELQLPHWQTPATMAEQTVVVRTIREGADAGKISALSVKTDATETPVANLAALTKLLQERRAGGKLGNADCVAVSGENKLKMAAVADVVEACRAAGVTTVTLAPPHDLAPEAVATKSAPPDAAAQTQAEKDVKAYYKALYDQPAVAELARRLRQASDYCSDPAAKFVLLRESADAAARAGSLPASQDALDQLSKEFRVDVWALKLEKFKGAPGTKPVVEAALKEAGSATLQGRLDYGMRFLKIADVAAKESKDKKLIASVEERRRTFKIPKVDDLDPFAALPTIIPNQERPTKPKETKPADDAGDDPSSAFQWMIFLFGILAVLVLVIGGGVMGWHLRKGDRAVQSRLAETRKNQFNMPGDGGPPAG